MSIQFSQSIPLYAAPIKSAQGIRQAVASVRFSAIEPTGDQFNKRFTNADLFAKALKNEGVDIIYGVPGEETLDLLEGFRRAGIPFITTRDEESAGFMAATHGRLTGKPGVVLTTLGPGAAKLTNPAAYAQLGGMPLVMLTGQKPMKNNKQGRFQLVDIVRMLEPLAKFSRRVETGDSIPRLVREAFKQATLQRPGAVHLELPEDLAAEPADPNAPIFAVEKIQPPVAHDAAIKQASDLIAQAKRPLILIGTGAKRLDTRFALTDFINKTGIPFMTTQMGKGVVDENHPLYMGTPALSENDYIHCAIERADLIINVGHDPEEKPPYLMDHAGDQKVVHVNFEPAEADNIYFPQVQIVGDIESTMKRMRNYLLQTTDIAKNATAQQPSLVQDFKSGAKPVSGTQRLTDFVRKNVLRQQQPAPLTPVAFDTAFYKRSIDFIQEHVDDKRDATGFPVPPQRFVADVQAAMPEDGIVTLDNGMYKIWFARNFKSRLPESLMLDNTLATMGAGLPSAMEAARLYPNRKVLAVAGDGGLMMSVQELETAVREKLNLVVLVLNDNGYGMIQWKQQTHGLPDYGLKFGNPDFVKLAESFGAKGHRISQSGELTSRIQQSFAEGGVHVIELPIEYSANQAVLVDELKLKSCPI